ncbi:MAG: DUF2141 domain-containing protein [Bacteroidota bacterium]
MKTLTLTVGLFLVSFITFAQETTGVDITVTIDNVANDQGKVLIALHTKETFLKGKGIKNQKDSIKDGKVSFVFENVPEGTYAILALHDANENNQMDFDSGGVPTESYGMPGNEMFLGWPDFEDAQFEVKGEDLEFEIRF